MFKSVATKLAHNTTVPSLGGNKDLRSLQDLITAEKTVLSSSQKFALDLAKSAEALKNWGHGEGDDLADVSTAATTLVLHLAGAINHFSNIESAIREQMKAVRTREEALDEMRRRRRTMSSKAEDAERKLHKMSPDNKNFNSQTEMLTRFRDDIRLIDTDIMNEEAGIGDFKRHSMRNWLGSKFGGIQDFCEKGLIVSDLGKQLLTVIPIEPTQPGLPRPYYTGHAQTEIIIAEGQRGVQDVVFSVEPGTGRRAGGGSTVIGGLPSLPQNTGQSQSYTPLPQSRPLSSQFSPSTETPTTANSFSAYMPNLTTGDRPGETLMRADSVTHGSNYPPTPQSSGFSQPQQQAGSIPLTPQGQYIPPQGPPPGQGYSSPTGAQQLPNYPTRASFVGLPQIPQQQVGSDFGMTPYLSPTTQEGQLPSVPEQQFDPYSQQQQMYQQQASSPYQQQQYPYQQQPEPQTYPQQQQHLQQHPMPQSSEYAHYTYPQAPGAQPTEVNEFGTYATPSGVYGARTSSLHGTTGDGNVSPTDPTSSRGRFATFPVKIGPRPPGAASPAPTTSTTGSAPTSAAPPMSGRPPSVDVQEQEDSFSSSVAEALGQQWQPGSGPQGPQALSAADPQQQPHHVVEQSQVATTGHAPHDATSIPGRPPSYDDATSSNPSSHPAAGGEGDTALAYMSEPEGDDVKVAHDAEGHHAESYSINNTGGPQLQNDHVPNETPANTYTVASPPIVTPHRAPTPSEEGHDDENSLNAAAAREVSRELDQLMISSQVSSQLPPSARPSSPPQPSPQPAYQFHRAQSPPTSPTSGLRETQYVREKDRSPGDSQQPTPSITGGLQGGQSPLIPPPTISIPGGSPAGGSTASFRTPPEYPAATSPGQFYNLGSPATGSSTSFIPGATPRTISAAAFKRQVRQPTNPANMSMDGGPDGGISDTTPLHVKKRLPASPYPAGRIQGGDGTGDMQRIPSAPLAGHLQEPGVDPRYRSASAGHLPPDNNYHQDHQREGAQNEDDDYDYISAYVNSPNGPGEVDHGELR